MKDGKQLALLALLGASLLWGTTGTAAAHAHNVSPLAIGAASLGIGGLLQAVIALGPLRRSWTQLRSNAGMVSIGSLGVLVYPLAFYTSMQLGGVALGTVISLGSAPLFSGLLERIVDQVKLTRRWYIAAALGISGSVLLCFSRASGGEDNSGNVLLSCALGLVAGGSYAIYSWATGRLLAAGITRRAAVGSVFGLGGVLLMPVLFLTGAPLLQSTTNLVVAAYLALIPMFLGYVLFGLALSRVSASTATTVTLSEPAFAAALAVGVLGERFGILGWVGIGLIAGALGVLLVRGRTVPTSTLESGQLQTMANPY